MCSNLTMGVCDWDSAALACKDLGHPKVGNLQDRELPLKSTLATALMDTMLRVVI